MYPGKSITKFFSPFNPLVKCGSVARSLWTIVFRNFLAAGSATYSGISSQVSRAQDVVIVLPETLEPRLDRHIAAVGGGILNRTVSGFSTMQSDLVFVPSNVPFRTTVRPSIGVVLRPRFAISLPQRVWADHFHSRTLRRHRLHKPRGRINLWVKSSRQPGQSLQTTLFRRNPVFRSSRCALISPPGPPPMMQFRHMRFSTAANWSKCSTPFTGTRTEKMCGILEARKFSGVIEQAAQHLHTV